MPTTSSRTSLPALHPTRCAICGTENNATELFPATLGAEAFSPEVFSARRLPDRVHYRIVRCDSCGLVRSDPIADPAALARLYARSTFDYQDEVENIQRSYTRYLRRLRANGGETGDLLEIGCGSGFMLEAALALGFAEVRGVEPSEAAVAAAPAAIRARIIRDVLRPDLFPPASFDAICMFQVLDHIADPRALLDECHALLRPGGLMLCLNHNVEALSARILGERSPIIDVEHTYLYGPATMRALFAGSGFAVRELRAAFNTYSLHYLVRLLPLPVGARARLLPVLASSRLGRLRISVPLGNLYIVAQKPPAAAR